MLIIELLLGLCIGCLIGIFTGITPGVHINLVSVIILSLSPWLLQHVSPLTLALVIVGMTIVHTFLDSIPATFLGAPDSDEILSVLPGHKLLLDGKGYEAVTRTVIGTLAAAIVMIALTPVLIFGVNVLYPLVKEKMSIILLVLCCFFIWKEPRSKLWALLVFSLAGVLGIVTLTFGLKDPLFPLFSGLFGTAGLLLSINDKVNVPEQKISFPTIEKNQGFNAITSAVISGSVCSMLPGLGPSQAAMIGAQFTKAMTSETFLILNSALNMVNMMMSFITLYAIDKGRNGAIVVVGQIIGDLGKRELLILLAAVLIALGIGTWLTLNLTKIFAKLMTKINYKKLCIGIIVFVTSLVIFMTSWQGLLIYLTATSLGLLPPLKNVGRSHMMGCLLVPIILFLML
ncbi:tripartite tricarboxylate transporter permease [Candidatus Woesearchaeota archaeon]|nr:tripartite tricarboxylate transporter permease [Candidatus Woesearchaeota archaeon]